MEASVAAANYSEAGDKKNKPTRDVMQDSDSTSAEKPASRPNKKVKVVAPGTRRGEIKPKTIFKCDLLCWTASYIPRMNKRS